MIGGSDRRKCDKSAVTAPRGHKLAALPGAPDYKQPVTETRKLSAGSLLIVAWGVLGVAMLLGQAIYRLAPLAIEPLRGGELSSLQIVAYVGFAGFMGYSEGYRGFQKRFSPKVVTRAIYLMENPRPLHVLFAPAFCMAYFHATKRGLLTSWGVSSMVVVLIILVRGIAQPWRGIIDGGVVLGLSWGVGALLYHTWVALRGGELDAQPELPITDAAAAT
jgi:hypothetical protein